MENRRVTYRLLPGSRAKAAALSRLAGANRWVWNQILAQIQEEVEAGENPSTSFLSLVTRVTKLRRYVEWLQTLPAQPVNYCTRLQADAWTQYFQRKGGKPKFKARGAGRDSFTLPAQMLEYKADEVIRVDPRYTSQTCFECGHVDRKNRKSQSKFRCVACNYSDNADANAAMNILDRGYGLTALGTGASGRREAFPQVASATGTSETRQKIRRRASATARVRV